MVVEEYKESPYEGWVCKQDPRPGPTYEHRIQAEAFPARCGPCAQETVGETTPAPARVCLADDRFPPHPYAPPPERHDFERLPITSAPPERRQPLRPAISYFPQPTLSNHPPPCCARDPARPKRPDCPPDYPPDPRQHACCVDADADMLSASASHGREAAAAGLCPPLPVPSAPLQCSADMPSASDPQHACPPCGPQPPEPCAPPLPCEPRPCPPPPCAPPPCGPPICPPPPCGPPPCIPPNTFPIHPEAVGSCNRLVSEAACPRLRGCSWPAKAFKPCKDDSGTPDGPPCFLPWEARRQAKDDPNAPDAGVKVVEKFNKMTYSDCDWREHYREVLGHFKEVHHAANCIDATGKLCMEGNSGRADEAQERSTRALRDRDAEIQHWKCRLERALVAMAEEQNLLQQMRHRVRTAIGILQLPQDIAAECLTLRLGRLDCDNQRDEVEAELIKEANLMLSCRVQLDDFLKQIEQQLDSNMNTKNKCEFDWSDKKMAHDIEVVNLSLTNTTEFIMFRPGATRVPADQASLETWDVSTRESIEQLEAELDKSVKLRAHVEETLSDMIRQMRVQADKVETLLENSIAEMDACRAQLETDLQMLLQRLAGSERLVDQLKQTIRNHDAPMKKAQTRLCARHQRPRAENCRDPAQDSLLDEVAQISKNVAALKGMLQQAEENMRCLLHQRHVLEREIQVKRNTLFINRSRLRAVRAHYPSAAALSGGGH